VNIGVSAISCSLHIAAHVHGCLIFHGGGEGGKKGRRKRERGRERGKERMGGREEREVRKEGGRIT